MRRFLFVVAAILVGLHVAAPVRAEQVTVAAAFPPGADTQCADGLTAIQRLPPVRTVIFDPISNSFAFLTCDPDGRGSEQTVSNQDYLDRNRLALTTQKIRLLILPYNPADGNLTLVTVKGDGVEFTDIVGGLPPQSATTTTREQPREEEQPEMPELSNSRLDPAVRSRAQEMRGEADRVPREGETTYSNLAALDFLWEEYSRLADETNAGLQSLHTRERCIGGNLMAAPSRFTRELALNADAPFSLERDVSLDEVREEATRRVRLIPRDFYEPCRLDPQAASFQGDISAFEAAAEAQAVNFGRLKRHAQEMTRVVRRLPISKPVEVSQEEWRGYLDALRLFLNQVDDFNTSLQAELEEILQAARRFRDEHDSLLDAQNAPAMHIQRFNYPPLEDGKSITFTIRRGDQQEGDGPMVPDRVNTIEIRSAPVHTMRFAMGLVASRLADPTFETIAIAPEDDDSTAGEEEEGEEPTPTHILRFEDESNGKVIPGLFLHHYWGRRSPLLEPTLFERWMPTLSFGIPVSEAEALSQFFLGLNWELVPGFEAHVGYHFGKVNSLVRGFRVGDPLPTGVDATAVQKKKFDSAVYFGIAVNREAFERAFGNGGN